jgi:hypothetical protein
MQQNDQAAPPRRSIWPMERISGPYKGYFIAAYTVQAGTTFVGYAKVCTQEPESVWTNSVQKLISVSGYKSELEAVQAAEQKARELIAEREATSQPGALN